MKGMITVGLTGQSGAGKTAIAKVFADEGFGVINCDIVARKAVEPDTDCTKELSAEFPELFENGALNRAKAAAALFSDRKMLEHYNSVIFPHINRLIEAERKALADSGYKYILLDAPTLFEAGADRLCDIVVSCTADENIRLARITERDGIDEELAKKRFSSQHSEDFFRSRSDFVIENNGDKKTAENAVRNIIKQIKGRTDD
jgi:dephospho-CoA kinase